MTQTHLSAYFLMAVERQALHMSKLSNQLPDVRQVPSLLIPAASRLFSCRKIKTSLLSELLVSD